MKNHPAFKILTSLWVTVVLLSLSLFIIFFGTMAQEPMGLNIAVERYFKSWFIDWVALKAGLVKAAQLFGANWTPVTPEQILGPGGLPAFPGGYLVGTLLLVNLLAAYYARFEWSAKKAGIFCSHLGIITLLLSQLFTDIYSVESFVSMERGDRRNYTVSFDDNELACILQVTNQTGTVVSNRVVSIPEPWLKEKKKVVHPKLQGLTVTTKKYWVNARPMTAAQLIEWMGEQQKATEQKTWDLVYALCNQRIAAMEAKLDRDKNATQRSEVTAIKGVFFEMRANEIPVRGLYIALDRLGAIERRVMGYPENDPRLIVNHATLRDHLITLSGYDQLAQNRRLIRDLVSSQIKELGTDFTYEEFERIIGRLADIKEVPPGLNPETAKDLTAFAKRLQSAAKTYRTGTNRGKLGNHYWFVRPLRPVFDQNDRNQPAAVIEIAHQNEKPSTWLVSGRTDFQQNLNAGGRTWKIILRPKRHYLDFHLTLVDLKWEKYRGTEIPKNFQSRVIVEDGGETRTVDIKMNEPLRNGGQTFYQYQMNENQLGATVQTMLQVVKNPNWRTAYVGCAIVAAGLLYQFIFHLIGFARRRRKAES